MGTKLRRMLDKHKDKLVASIVEELRKSDAVHYQELEPEVLTERIVHLVDEFLDTMAGESKGFTEFILRLTEERMAEGFQLSEIQTMLNALDEQACDLALKHSDESKVDKHLLRICHTISQAKDQLAYTYYLGKQKAESRLEELEGKHEDGAPSVEGEGAT
jgi:hypothetical protein